MYSHQADLAKNDRDFGLQDTIILISARFLLSYRVGGSHTDQTVDYPSQLANSHLALV